jgi:hypothetical protein
LGEQCTLKWLRHHGKPYLDIGRAAPPPVEEVAAWIKKHNIQVLNVPGNVEPKSKKAKASGITELVIDYLSGVFVTLGHSRPTKRPLSRDNSPAVWTRAGCPGGIAQVAARPRATRRP